MTSTSVGAERSSPSIHAVLAPERRAEFEAEFRIAVAGADEDVDLAPVQAVVHKWWPHRRESIPVTALGTRSGWSADDRVRAVSVALAVAVDWR